MEIRIEQTTDYPYDLLLLADPNRELVDSYLKTSDCFVALCEGQAVGVIVVQKQSVNGAEVLNLAVGESFQRRGIARRLLRFVFDEWARSNRSVESLYRYFCSRSHDVVPAGRFCPERVGP